MYICTYVVSCTQHAIFKRLLSEIDSTCSYAYIYLSVSDAPVITPVNSSINYVLAGQELHLQCGYVGVPAPIIQWFQNKSLLTNGSGGVSITGGAAAGDSYSSMVIARVDRMSGGTYTCQANNTLGSSEVNYTVHILSKSFKIAHSNHQTFTCH